MRTRLRKKRPRKANFRVLLQRKRLLFDVLIEKPLLRFFCLYSR